MVGVRGQGRRFDTRAALGSATQIFWKHGYEGTSIAVLTKAMGITTSSLYAAFGGKRELFDSVVEHYSATDGHFTSLAFEEEKHARPLIRRLLSEAAIHYAAGSGPGGCLIVSAAVCVSDANRDVAKPLEAHRTANIRMIKDLISIDIASGIIPSTVKASSLADFVGTVLQGMALRGRDGASIAELSETATMTYVFVEQRTAL